MGQCTGGWWTAVLGCCGAVYRLLVDSGVGVLWGSVQVVGGQRCWGVVRFECSVLVSIISSHEQQLVCTNPGSSSDSHVCVFLVIAPLHTLHVVCGILI